MLKVKCVAISTLHFYNNFGSVLQAYALKTTLNKFGYGADILDYQPHISDYKYFSDTFLQEQYELKKSKFDLFRREKLKISDRRSASVSVQELFCGYDAYITGSDIVWGKEFSGLDPAYFLAYAGDNKPKIAYAASMIINKSGTTEDDAIYSKYVPRFTSIGMRETSSVEVIKRFSQDISVIDVLDPTLLLGKEEYAPLEIENEIMKGKPYLLSYFLTHDPAVVDYTNMLAKKLGLRIIHYFADYPNRIFPSDAECFAFAGPGEFLGYIKNAACVFTNSFHGTCFSMIYRKPFYTYMAKRNMLSRVRDTVERLQMTDRYFTDFRDLDKVTLEIDYSQMELALEKHKKKSIDFLRTSLENV